MEVIFDEKDIKEIEENFYNFLINFYTIDGEGRIINKYLEKLRDVIAEEDKRSIVVDWEDVGRFNHELAEKILTKPDIAIVATNNALRRALKEIHEDMPEDILRRYVVRFRRIGFPTKIRDLTKADFVDNFVRFKAIIVKATRIKEILKRAYFQCKVCGTKFPLEFRDEFVKPSFCINPNCDNEDPRKFTLLQDGQEFEEYQVLTAQELPEELPPGQLPQSINVIVRGDLAGKIRPGDRVTINGILKVAPDRDLKVGRKPLFTPYIESTMIEKESTDEEELTLTDEERKMILSLKEDKDLEKKIVQSIAPSIYGEEEIKMAIAALLFGGIPKILPDGTKIRGTINVLLVGDPGTGKSLTYSQRIIYLEEGELKVEEIGKFVDRILERGSSIKKGDTEIAKVEGIYVPSITKDFKLEFKRVKAVMRHRAPKDVVVVKTKSGREVIVTKDHSLLKFNGVSLEVVKGSEIRRGDLIPLLRTITFNGKKEIKIGEKNIKLDALFGKFLGIFLGDGTILYSNGKLYGDVTTTSEEILNTLEKFFSTYGFKYSKLNTIRGDKRHLRLQIHDKDLVDWLINNCFNNFVAKTGKKGEKTRMKKFPEELYSSNRVFLEAVIEGLIESDGWYEGEAEVITTVSKNLANGLYNLLILTGKLFTFRKGYKRYKGEKIPVYTFRLLPEREVDLIDKVVIPKTVVRAISKAGLNSRLSGNRKLAGESRGKVYRGYSGRKYARKMLEFIQDEKLEKIVKEERIFWDEVSEVKVVPINDVDRSDFVYDLEVEDTENFVAEGIFVHNSQLLKYVANLAPRAIYTSGKGASAAGLTAAVVKSEDEWILEAGVLVLADKGIACLHPDSRVLIDGKFTKIKDLFNLKKSYKALSGDEIVYIQEEEHDIVALNLERMKIVNSRSIIIRRKPWSGKLLRIKFLSGNEIVLTPDHLLIDGKTLEWKEAMKFNRGDYVVAPLKLPSVKEKVYILDILPPKWRVKLNKEEKEELKREVLRRFKNLAEFNRYYNISKDFLSGKGSITIDKFRKILKDFGIYDIWKKRTLTYGPYSRRERLKVSYITPELAYFLGFLYGDGWVQRDNGRVGLYITQSEVNKKQINRLRKIFTAFYPKELRRYKRVTESKINGEKIKSNGVLLVTNSPLLAFLYDYLTKNDLENVFKLDDEALKGFIAGALDSDGCVSIKRSDRGKVIHVEFLLSNDIKKDRAFAMLLRRFNIYARVIEGGSVNKIMITGREDVRNLLEVVKNYSVKVKKLSTKKHLVSATSDKIPTKPTKHIAKKIIKQVSVIVLQRKGLWSTLYSYANEKYFPSRLQIKKIVEKIGDNLSQETKQKLEILASRDYFLDKIISIEYIPYKGYVYDIYVPVEHNFIAEGIIVHNCIDEFDKMSSEDRKALHEAMEQQTISIAKAGIVATLNARTSILAAANPKLGRYNDKRSIAENINLPPTILSRFDLIFVMKDVPNRDADKQKAEYILGLHAGDIRAEPPIPASLMKKFILYAREHVFPKLTDKAIKKIQDFYLQMRVMSAKETEEGFEPSPIAITTRQLEALVRLAEAHARMLLKDEIDEEDADFAIRLVKYSLEQVGKDPESGKIDTGVLYTGVTHTKRSRYIQVLDILRALEKEEEYKNGVPVKKIIEIAEQRGIQEEFVLDVLRKEIQSGNIYEPRPGHYKTA